MTTKTELLRAIRQHCMECCSSSYTDIEMCPGSENCAIHPFRLGVDPNPPEISEARLAVSKQNMVKIHEAKNRAKQIPSPSLIE